MDSNTRSINEVISSVHSRFRGNNLKARGIRGALILISATSVERTLKFVRNMLLTRILAPEAFGTMAMVIAAASIFETLSDVGVRQSIIHNKKGGEEKFLNVAWWFQGLRGIVLYILAFVASPWIGRFYNMPELLPLLKVSFMAMIFNGFTSPRVYVMEKKLQFGRYVILTQGSGLLGTLLTIILAFYLQNVWALIIGFVAEAASRCVLSFFFCPIVPRLSIDKDSLRDLMHFAKGIFGLSFLTVFIAQIPVMVLGKAVPGVQLGIYYMVFQLAEQPVQLYDRIVGRIILPAFAEKQDSKEAICRTLLSMSKIIGILGIPMIAFVWSCPGLILSLIYGSKFAKATIPFGLLCIWAVVFTQAINFSLIFLGLGVPWLHRRAVVLRGLLLAGLIYPCTVYWGISGAAATVLAAYSASLIMPLVWIRNLIGLNLREYIQSWLPGLLLSGFILIPLGLLNLANLEYEGINAIVAGLAYLVVVVVGSFYLNRRYKLI